MKRRERPVEPNSPSGPAKALCRSRQIAKAEAQALPPERRVARGRPRGRRLA